MSDPISKKLAKKAKETKFVPEVEEEEAPIQQVQINSKNFFQPPDLKEVITLSHF
jgi:hypothetical protein